MKRRVLLIACILATMHPMNSVPATPRAQGTEVLIAWAPENMPWRTERALDNMKGVEATTVVSGIMWLKRSTTPSGKVVDAPPDGYGIPMEVAFVAPKEYSRYVGEGADAIASLHGRQALMPEGAIALRRGHSKLDIKLGRHRLRVVGSVPDQATQGYEVLMPAPPPESFDQRLRQVLIKKEASVSRADIRRKIAGLLPPGAPLAISGAGEVPFLRYADSVHPLFVFKKRFGEFAAVPSDSGAFSIEPSWVEHHITTRSVPILGSVRCHEGIFKQLRGALEEIEDEGLAGTIDPGDYAGCYNSRFVATVPGTRISRHSWGIAVDINATGNGFGDEPTQDRRMVKIFESWGFLWGGRWPLKDGMHFEWATDP